MNPVSALRPVRLALLAALALSAGPVLANPNLPSGAPDYAIEFPAGWACSNFGLRLEGWAGKGQYRDLKDRNGYTRLAFAGTGEAWRLTNMLNGKSMSTQNNGASAFYQIYQADGSVKAEVHGHLLLIWYPTDLPAGPSASLHSGFTSYQLSPAGQGTLLAKKGHSTDLCVALN